MNELDRFLIDAICAMTDPIANFSGQYETPEDALLTERILNVLGRTHFTDSMIDDLLELADSVAPITLRANHRFNYTPYNSTMVNLDRDHAIISDYALN